MPKEKPTAVIKVIILNIVFLNFKKMHSVMRIDRTDSIFDRIEKEVC